MDLEDLELDRFNSSMFIEDGDYTPSPHPPKKNTQNKKIKTNHEYGLGSRDKEVDLLLVPGLQVRTEHVTNGFYALWYMQW